jgi:ribosome-interacting GTPase 1
LNKSGIEELKEKIFKTFNILRIYTKHPGKKEKLDNKPVILPPKSTLEDVAEKILHGYSKKVKYAKITGPSCKFPNQKIGLKHIVKDKDQVEFFTD